MSKSSESNQRIQSIRLFRSSSFDQVSAETSKPGWNYSIQKSPSTIKILWNFPTNSQQARYRENPLFTFERLFRYSTDTVQEIFYLKNGKVHRLSVIRWNVSCRSLPIGIHLGTLFAKPINIRRRTFRSNVRAG